MVTNNTFCQCGCGLKTNLATRTRNGNIKGRPLKFISGHTSRYVSHGMSYTSTYKIWQGMHQRCRNTSDPAYKNYGHRGISICNRWYKFDKFLKDMGERPLNRTLDRIDNNGNYEPSNCRWATSKQQGKNKRNSYTISHAGLSLTLNEWSEVTGIKRGTLTSRHYGRGLNPPELFYPVR